jgi:hypothetical protein
MQLTIRLTSPYCSIFDVYKDTLSPQIKKLVRQNEKRFDPGPLPSCL